MRNLGQDELWSVRAWTIGGLVVGLAVGLVVLATVGWSSSVLVAPVCFAFSAYLAVRQHNGSVARYRHRDGA